MKPSPEFTGEIHNLLNRNMLEKEYKSILKMEFDLKNQTS